MSMFYKLHCFVYQFMSEEAYANDALRETWLDNNMILSVFSLPAFSYLLSALSLFSPGIFLLSI